MESTYNAYLLLCLPETIKDLPFYNLHINVDGDSIGSSYAIEIAKKLFEDFEKLCNKEQLADFLKLVNYRELRLCLEIKIVYKQNPMKEINDGAEQVGHSVIHAFLDLVTQKVKS